MPGPIDGISYAPTLLGSGEQPTHDYLYWEFYEQGGKQAVRWGDWKGVRLNVRKERYGPIELYNLKQDLGETTNLAADHPDVVSKLEQLMRDAHTESELVSFSRN